MKNIYIGRYSKDTGIGICSYSDGELIEHRSTSYIQNPSYLHKNGDTLYAALENEEYNGVEGGAVASFSIGNKLELTSIQNTLGKHPCHLVTNRDRTMLFTANYSSGSVSAFALQPNGTICEASLEIEHEGKGINPDRQEKAHVHYLEFMQNEKYLCAVDLGIDCIVAYQPERKEDLVELKECFRIKLAQGAGPRHLVLSEKEQYCYVICELKNEIHVFRRVEEISFELIQVISTLPKGITVESAAAAIRMSSDGRFIYVSNRGYDSISVFLISEEDGQLSHIQNIDCGGNFPRDIILDDAEEYLLVANQGGNSITTLRRDKSYGILSECEQIFSTECPTCIL